MTFLGGGRACVGVKFAQLQMSAFFGSATQPVTTFSHILITEVVLSTLVENFTFAPGSKEIIWQLNGVIQPTTKDAAITSTGHRQLQLPLKLTYIEGDD